MSRARSSRRHRPDGAKHLDLLVADHVGLVGRGPFHGGQRDELQEVVLEHVAEHADTIVVAAAAADRHFLGHRDLHVIDVVAVPYRFENAVGEPQDHQVLDRLLAQVMINAIDLAFLENLVHRLVELLGRSQIGAEGLLDHQAAGCRRLVGHARRPQVRDGGRKKRGAVAR